MPTILADSFIASLAKLDNNEQKQAKLTTFDLQANPDNPGLKFHRVDKSRDPNFWSVRVNRDIRIIVHKTGASVLLAYVDHHDAAYAWAERRRIEAHPKTGALQIVEVRELVEQISPVPPMWMPQEQAELELVEPVVDHPASAEVALFSALSDNDLLSVGIPEDWLPDIKAANEDDFLTLAGHLPQEAAEALLEYVAGGQLPLPIETAFASALVHPDTQRRFRVIEGIEELQAALDAPFDQWTVFLHPSQRAAVDRVNKGPARVAGSAGTGKTVVALHRVMRYLKEDPQAKILLTTFSEPLASELSKKLAILTHNKQDLVERVTVGSFQQIAEELFALANGRQAHLADQSLVNSIIARSATEQDVTGFSTQFLNSEWQHVIDAWQISDAEKYAEVPRMGRKNRLGAKQRERLWGVFSKVRQDIVSRGLMTASGLFQAAARHYTTSESKPFTHIVVDEAQDLGVPELRFLASIAPGGPDALFFAGDLGQRIFQQPFSWKGLGVDVLGRSMILNVNYRTSHQIRKAADRLMPAIVRDVDGQEDDRTATVSVFEGPEPHVCIEKSEEAELVTVSDFLKNALEDGVEPSEIAIFVRSEAQLARACAAATTAQLAIRTVATTNADESRALVGVMHLAKGLEFRAVTLMACDENILPLESRVADVADEFELDEVIATERQLLYVAATRARDRLLISGVAPGSEFLDDLCK